MTIRAGTLLLACAVCSAEVKIISVEPTVLFPRQEPLRQIAMMTVLNNGSTPVDAEALVQLTGRAAEPAVALKATPGVSRHRVFVPDIDKPSAVRFELRAKGDRPDVRSIGWEPQRKWKVFMVRSSHEDLGYESYIFKKQHDIANFVDLAREQSGHTENLSDLERRSDARYHYTMESLLFQRNYIDERGEAAWREVVNKDVKSGRIHLMGAPSGVHSHWMDYEELARMTYPAKRETLDRFGLELKTFMIVDNPSLSWSGAQVLANAGFRYIARWGQSWRTNGNNDYARTKVPALFWWKTPDGSRILFGWRSHYSQSFWYGSGAAYGGMIDLGTENVSQILKRVESGEMLGPYPYDALINPEYTDHDIPRADARMLPVWREQYAYPLIRIASPDEFFEYVEKSYGSRLPELTGDLNNFSADYASIDPESQGWKRRAARVLPLAEGFAALASLFDSGVQPVLAEAARIWTRIYDYDEHSWPTLPPASDVQLFNANWIKKDEARRALDASDELLNRGWKALARQIPVGASKAIVVFNPLAHSRDDLVTVEGTYPSLIDSVTGERVACQGIDGGKTVFIAKAVPAFGYKVFRIGSAAKPESTLEASEDGIRNQFYETRFDRATGTIASIVDRKSRRELVDQSAKYRFNQLVYVHKNQRESLEGFEHLVVDAKKTESRKGAVRAEFDVWIDDAKTGAAIRQTVMLYDGLPRIDIVNDLRHVKALYSNRYEDRYNDNLFYAFPIAVPGGQPRVEYPGGVTRPFKDQLRWGTHDNMQANRWVDVSTSAHGVTIAPWNAANFHFGEIRYNQFSINYEPRSPHLFSYAFSNRMAGLLTLNADDCNATLGYSILGHDGDWNSGDTTRFGWSVASPLEAFVAGPNTAGKLDGKQQSFLAVDAPNVQLTVLKASEQPGRGQVLRFVETEGKDTEFTLESKVLAGGSAYECDLAENDRGTLALEGDKVRVKVKAYGFATVRLARGTAPETPSGLKARAVSDSAVAVSWLPVKGATGYYVFRSDDPDAPPTAYTLVARTGAPLHQDSGLYLGTEYSYRVSAVNAGGVQSAVAAPVHVKTLNINTTAPAPVNELGVVRRSKERLIVYWRKSPEPDAARYYLYRGDRADFDIRAAKPLAILKPAGHFLDIYIDNGVMPGKTYFYKVIAEDWAANRQAKSPVAAGTTPGY